MHKLYIFIQMLKELYFNKMTQMIEKITPVEFQEW